jgi:hypothetical protein
VKLLKLPNRIPYVNGGQGGKTPVDVRGHYIYSSNKCLLWLKVSRQEKEGTDKNAVINAVLPHNLAFGTVTLSKHTSAFWPIAID